MASYLLIGGSRAGEVHEIDEHLPYYRLPVETDFVPPVCMRAHRVATKERFEVEQYRRFTICNRDIFVIEEFYYKPELLMAELLQVYFCHKGKTNA